MVYRIGDGLYETINDYSYYGVFADNNTFGWIQKDNKSAITESWSKGYYNGDFANIGNCNLTFIVRGGYWGDSTRAGVFALSAYNGIWSYGDGFRPVMV